MLYVVSTLILIGAILLCGLSGAQLWQGAPQDRHNAGGSAVEQFLTLRGSDGNNGRPANPLLEQVAAFALYLNPPPSPPRMASAAPAVAPPSAPRPPSPAPQFRLLAMSYYRSSPEMSLAMVWDARKGGYWIRKGDRLGHFVVERIEKEAIFYRDGDQLRQMTMTIKEPVPLARLKSKESTPTQTVAAREILVSSSK